MGQKHSKNLYIYRGVDEFKRDVTKVRVDPSVTSIEAYAFYNWRSLQSITLPHTITTIGHQAFRECTSLASITLPNSITTIGHCAFWGCSSLTSITLPNTITTIGNEAFSRCSSLTVITLPNSITTLGVFAGCTSLASITLPDSITTIGYQAFEGCSSLASVHLPENLIVISLTAFQGCVNLTSIEASYLSTTTLDNNNLDGFKNMLINAGFSTSNPDDIISNRQVAKTNLDVYYEWKRWARTSDVDGRFPLFTAAARCLQWSYMKEIFTSNMPVVNEIDVLTGLPLFMLAATGPTSDIESVYNLLKEYPSAMNIMNNSHD